MAIGFIYTGSEYATPDKTMTKSSRPRVLVSKFGDGYEQRAPDGINNIEEVFSLQFRTRENDFVDDVVAFLDSKGGHTKFAFRFPDSNEIGGEKEIKVICDDYSTTYEYDNFYTLSVNLRRVYEA